MTGALLLTAVFAAVGVGLWPTGSRAVTPWRARATWRFARPGRCGRARRQDAPADSSARPTVTEVASACDLVALALASGAPIDRALLCVADSDADRTGVALRAFAAGRAWGLPPDGAARLLHAGWAPLVEALDLADRAGVPPSGVLRRAAADLRTEQRHRIDGAVARLRVQVVLPLGLCFLPAFVLTTVLPVVLQLSRQMVTP